MANRQEKQQRTVSTLFWGALWSAPQHGHIWIRFSIATHINLWMYRLCASSDSHSYAATSHGTWGNIHFIQSWIVSVYTFSKIHSRGLGSFDDDDRHTVAPVFHSRHRLFDVQLDIADNQLHKKRMTFLFGSKRQRMVVRTHWCREGCLFCMKSASVSFDRHRSMRSCSTAVLLCETCH